MTVLQDLKNGCWLVEEVIKAPVDMNCLLPSNQFNKLAVLKSHGPLLEGDIIMDTTYSDTFRRCTNVVDMWQMLKTASPAWPVVMCIHRIVDRALCDSVREERRRIVERQLRWQNAPFVSVSITEPVDANNIRPTADFIEVVTPFGIMERGDRIFCSDSSRPGTATWLALIRASEENPAVVAYKRI